MQIEVPADSPTAKRLQNYQDAGGDLMEVLEAGLDLVERGLADMDALKAHLRPLFSEATTPFHASSLHEEFLRGRASQ